jgi:hypothetical protein
VLTNVLLEGSYTAVHRHLDYSETFIVISGYFYFHPSLLVCMYICLCVFLFVCMFACVLFVCIKRTRFEQSGVSGSVRRQWTSQSLVVAVAALLVFFFASFLSFFLSFFLYFFLSFFFSFFLSFFLFFSSAAASKCLFLLCPSPQRLGRLYL